MTTLPALPRFYRCRVADMNDRCCRCCCRRVRSAVSVDRKPTLHQTQHAERAYPVLRSSSRLRSVNKIKRVTLQLIVCGRIAGVDRDDQTGYAATHC